MSIRSECLSCILRMQLEKIPIGCMEEEKLLYKQRVLKVLSEAKVSESAPLLIKRINDIQTELFGNSTDYTEIKRFYNNYVSEKQTKIENDIAKAEDSLLRAMQYSLTGNYIDFGAMENVDNARFEQFLSDASSIHLGCEYEQFCQDLEHAKRLVFLTDNCGEIVFDQILVRTIKRLYPAINITVIVRGNAVLNDATLEDAFQIGLTEECDVIGNGTNIAGTCLNLISNEARRAIDLSDVIISKGQGNFETLQDCGLNVYYLFMCKCEMFAKRFQVDLYTGMLINDKRKGI